MTSTDTTMSNTPLPEPYGCVTLHTVSGLEFFYRHPEPPYLDTAKSCTVVYATEALHAHAAAVSAAKDARIKVLESALERTATALNLAYSKKPLRDMAETLAEARAALGDKTCSD